MIRILEWSEKTCIFLCKKSSQIAALRKATEETSKRWSRKQKVCACMATCLLHRSFKRDWALNMISFCKSSMKEHNYFFYLEWKIFNTSISFKDASHTLQHEIVCRLTYTCYITAAPENTVAECSWTPQHAEWPKDHVKSCTGNLSYPPVYVPFSCCLQSACGTFLSRSFMRFKQQFRTWCHSFC